MKKIKEFNIVRIMKKLPAALLLIVIFHFSALTQYDPDATKILDAMSDKYQNLQDFSATVQQSMINEMEGIDEELPKAEIYVKKDMYKLSTYEQVIYNDGTTVWTYLPESNEVNIANFDPEEGMISPAEIYNIYKEGYKYNYLGELKNEGRTLSIVELAPEDREASQFYKIRMVIDKGDNTLRNWKMFQNGGNIFEYKIADFKSNLGLNDSFFVFDVSAHQGVEVIDFR